MVAWVPTPPLVTNHFPCILPGKGLGEGAQALLWPCRWEPLHGADALGGTEQMTGI